MKTALTIILVVIVAVFTWAITHSKDPYIQKKVKEAPKTIDVVPLSVKDYKG